MFISLSAYFSIWPEVLSSLKATFEAVHLCKSLNYFQFSLHLANSSFIVITILTPVTSDFTSDFLLLDFWIFRLNLLSPPDPLVGNPLVAIEHRATLMIHPWVDAAVRPPGVHQSSPGHLKAGKVHLVCQKTRFPAFGSTLRPSLGKTVRPPAVTVVRYSIAVVNLPPPTLASSAISFPSLCRLIFPPRP